MLVFSTVEKIGSEELNKVEECVRGSQRKMKLAKNLETNSPFEKGNKLQSIVTVQEN